MMNMMFQKSLSSNALFLGLAPHFWRDPDFSWTLPRPILFHLLQSQNASLSSEGSERKEETKNFTIYVDKIPTLSQWNGNRQINISW